MFVSILTPWNGIIIIVVTITGLMYSYSNYSITGGIVYNGSRSTTKKIALPTPLVMPCVNYTQRVLLHYTVVKQLLGVAPECLV